MPAKKFMKNIVVDTKTSLCRDRKDNIVLECAAAVKADFIVTGDKDLLCLKIFRKTRIVPPKKFLEILKK